MILGGSSAAARLPDTVRLPLAISQKWGPNLRLGPGFRCRGCSAVRLDFADRVFSQSWCLDFSGFWEC